MSEAEIERCLQADLDILKLKAQVKVLGSRLEIQARHAPGHTLKYDQAARLLRGSLRAQQGRHPALTGIETVTIMIGIQGDPQFLYNATVNLNASEAGDREAETIDLDAAPVASPQAETVYFDREKHKPSPPPADPDPEAETLVVGRSKPLAPPPRAPRGARRAPAARSGAQRAPRARARA
ncbi:MAG: hypothetical protein Q6K08_07545, partial [Thermostichales cyanobacterium GMQP_bins_62]